MIDIKQLLAEPALKASLSARQGDVLMRRLSDSQTNNTTKTPESGVVVQAGAHGEHKLVADAFARVDTDGLVFDLPAGARLVHTDAPDARHQAIQLEPGVWEFYIQRELRGGEVVQVLD